MSEQKDTNEAACGGSALTAELGNEPKRKHQYCSFCGAQDTEVGLLVSSYQAMICDRCVLMCCEIMQEKGIIELVPNAKVTGSPDLSASPCGLLGYATAHNGERK